jgi:hypothetical protein
LLQERGREREREREKEKERRAALYASEALFEKKKTWVYGQLASLN